MSKHIFTMTTSYWWHKHRTLHCVLPSLPTFPSNRPTRTLVELCFSEMFNKYGVSRNKVALIMQMTGTILEHWMWKTKSVLISFRLYISVKNLSVESLELWQRFQYLSLSITDNAKSVPFRPTSPTQFILKAFLYNDILRVWQTYSLYWAGNQNDGIGDLINYLKWSNVGDVLLS